MTDVSRPTEDAAMRRLDERATLKQRLSNAAPLGKWDYGLLDADRRDPVGAVRKLADRYHVAQGYIVLRLSLLSDLFRLDELGG